MLDFKIGQRFTLTGSHWSCGSFQDEFEITETKPRVHCVDDGQDGWYEDWVLDGRRKEQGSSEWWDSYATIEELNTAARN